MSDFEKQASLVAYIMHKRWAESDMVVAREIVRSLAPADQSDAGRDGKRDEIIEDCAKHLEKSGDGSANNIQTAAFYHAARLVRALKSAALALLETNK